MNGDRIKHRATSLRFALAGASALLLWSGSAKADSMADAKAVLQKYAGKVDRWDGPTSGLKAVTGNTIIVLGRHEERRHPRGVERRS